MDNIKIEHEYIPDRFFPRVDTRFYVDGVKHYYMTPKGESRPQMVQWWEPNKNFVQDVMKGEYYSKCPAHIRAIVAEQMPIVAIMLS